MNYRSQDRSPILRAALAAFAVFLNILVPGGWALAAPIADPLAGGVILCLAGGGTMVAPAAPDPSRPTSPEKPGHCAVCPLPTASIPPKLDAAEPARPVQYIPVTIFPADAPTLVGYLHPGMTYPRGPPA